jgi:hypothetical protein
MSGLDEFIVREQFAEETPNVVIVLDRYPGMGLFTAEYPWLRKPLVVARSHELLVRSATSHRAPIGYLDLAVRAGHPLGEPYWRAPARGILAGATDHVLRDVDAPWNAPVGGLDGALEFLASVRPSVPPQSFVFVVSDFVHPPSNGTWLLALARGWDVVAVIVQDPIWDRSFPSLDRLVIPFLDPADGRARSVRLTRREAIARRAAHVERFDRLRSDLADLGLDEIVISSDSDESVDNSFIEWADRRALGQAASL